MNKIPSGYNCDNCPYWEMVNSRKCQRENCKFGNTCKKDCSKENCEDVTVRCNFLNIEQTISEGQWMLWAKVKICGKCLDEEKES